MHINYDGNTFYINPFVTSGAGPRAVGTERGRWSNWQCNEVDRYGKKAAGNRRTFNNFNNKINKHKWKVATPHGRLPHTKHKPKFQAWSSLLFHCRHSSFNPSEAPPWDSRPVSGAGVVHYQLLHRPRSVPTALGPAPLATPLMCNKNLTWHCLNRGYDWITGLIVIIKSCL